MTNRLAALGIAVLMLAVTGPGLAASRSEYRKDVETLYLEWLPQLRAEAIDKGVSEETLDSAFDGVTLDWSLPDLAPPVLESSPPTQTEPQEDDRQQPEFDQPFRYFPERTLNNLVTAGQRRMSRHRTTLARIEEEYGVQGEILVALWARETSYGRVDIPHYAIRALATQAFIGRRAAFFRTHLLDALRILEAGHVTPARMRSSWAGAMGHTQMMPGEFDDYAVDFDNDGRRDIWNTIGDALASTAKNLQDHGWRSGETWGYEIVVPESFDCTLEGPDKGRPISEWVALGAARTFARSFPEERLAQTGFLLMPAGRYGPAFIALENFYVIKSYNTSDLYALYIGHLADRYLNNRRFHTGWGRVSRFTRSDVKDLQQRLVARDYDVGGIDGLIGFRTRVAVGLYQKSAGLAPGCYPSPDLITHIREADETGNER